MMDLVVFGSPSFPRLQTGLNDRQMAASPGGDRCKNVIVKKNVNVICLPTEHQGVHKNSFRNVRAFQDRIGIWKCWFLRRGENRSTRNWDEKSQSNYALDLALRSTNQWLNFFILWFIRKFPYNALSDWLKLRALSENRARVDDIKMAFKLLLRDLDKFDPN